jgi:cobalt-zinc-cadmium efflux system membrane fusion protein
MKGYFTFSQLLAVISVPVLIIIGCQGSSTHDHGAHGHGAKHAEEFERGLHRGRLLTEGSFSLELQIFETGVPPQYRVYAYDNGKQLTPKDFSATVLLKRLGGRIDQFSFEPVGDFLTSDKEVEEPHSFDVEVSAEYKSSKFSWKFPSYEGRTEIADDVANRSGIKTEKASSRQIRTVVHTRGKILPSEHRIAHIIPRFSGLVREGRKHIGDKVDKGEVLAIIESNESLQPFEVRSQISGTVVNGHLIVGEFVPENQWVYIVADLSEVWADFFVPLRERLGATVGQKVLISSVNGGEAIEGKVSYVAPYADDKSQSQLIRAVISNENNQFLPGMFVTGDIVVDESRAEVAVNKESLQTFRDWKVVFAKVGSTYEIKPVTLGKSDGQWIEVLEGLLPGEEYVTENSFLIKADILKSGASHDH